MRFARLAFAVAALASSTALIVAASLPTENDQHAYLKGVYHGKGEVVRLRSRGAEQR